MSYDVDFMVEIDGKLECVENFNHTSNTAELIEVAITKPLKALDGMLASDAMPFFAGGRWQLKNNSDKYKPYEPQNRWGSIDSTLIFLTDLHRQCQITPHATIRISA